MHNWSVLDYLVFVSDIFSSAGFEMVLVFFILSGFFIAHSFEKRKWRFAEFYLNRTLRIYPPYLASLIFSAFALVLVNKINPDLFTLDLPYERNQLLQNTYKAFNGEALGFSLLFNFDKGFIGMNLVYWSLVVEVLFYIIAPIVMRNWFVYFLMAVIGVLFVHNTSIGFLNSLSTYSIYFAVGIVLFHFRNHQLAEKVSEFKWSFMALSLILLLATIVLSVAKYKSLSAFTASGFSVISIILFIKISVPVNRISRWLMTLGKFSYSLYLFHVPVLLIIYALFTRFTNIYNFYSRVYWIAVPFILVISYIFYLIVEKMSLQLTDILKGKKSLTPFEEAK